MRTLYRIAAVILLLTAAAGPAAAQEIHAGLIGGPTLSQITWDDPTGTLDPRIGITAGFFMVIGAGGRFAVQPEVSLVQKGVVFPGVDAVDAPIEITYDLTYVEVPVLARVSHPVWSGRAFVLAGPIASYRSAAKLASSGYASVNAASTTAKFDLGAAVGAGMEFDVDGGSVQISLRLTHGFIDVDDSFAQAPGKNRALSLMIGFGRVYGRY